MWIGIIIAAVLFMFFSYAYHTYVIEQTLAEECEEAEEWEEAEDAQKQPNCTPPSQEFMVATMFGRPLCPGLLSAISVNCSQNLLLLLASSIALISKATTNELPTAEVVISVESIILLFLGSLVGYIGVFLWKAVNGFSPSFQEWLTIIGLFCVSYLSASSWSFTLQCDNIKVSMLSAKTMGLWFCISKLITLMGGYLGAQAENIYFPLLTTETRESILLRQKYKSWVLVLEVGVFGSLCFGYAVVNILISNRHESTSINSFSSILSLIAPVISVSGAVFAANRIIGLNRMLFYTEEGHSWWWWKPFFALTVPFGLCTLLATGVWLVMIIKNSISADFIASLILGLMGIFSTVSLFICHIICLVRSLHGHGTGLINHA